MTHVPWPSVEDDLAPWEIDPASKPTLAEVEALGEVIDDAVDERPIQVHLTANPKLFSPLLSGSHGHWVRPKVQFSNRFEADFMIAAADSVGIHWTYVELENPRAAMFLQNGELAKKSRQGIHQIHQWRDHVDRNGGEARRLRSEGGLGLPGVRPKSRGLVLVGRTEGRAADLAQRRRQLEEDERIILHSYDWLIDQIRAEAEDAKRGRDLGGPEGFGEKNGPQE